MGKKPITIKTPAPHIDPEKAAKMEAFVAGGKPVEPTDDGAAKRIAELEAQLAAMQEGKKDEGKKAEPLVNLNFKLPQSFVDEFQSYAFNSTPRRKGAQLVKDAFAAVKLVEAGQPIPTAPTASETASEPPLLAFLQDTTPGQVSPPVGLGELPYGLSMWQAGLDALAADVRDLCDGAASLKADIEATLASGKRITKVWCEKVMKEAERLQDLYRKIATDRDTGSRYSGSGLWAGLEMARKAGDDVKNFSQDPNADHFKEAARLLDPGHKKARKED